ncbi:MAG TPA: TetR/AcrR family transcriptional regulator [Chloroflexota bacterium]|jgi:TetR/AcrR family transcriptional regulator|nr:TetR/AcrR family transcriptional regulator [Chloroflexota bacterium]
MINQESEMSRGRRGQILHAALHVMAEHGFRGASIKRIAERAGLRSPALIYWYFKDKDALFEALLDEMAPFLGEVAAAEPHLDRPPERVLGQVASAFLRALGQPDVARLARVLLSESARHPAAAAFFARRGPLVVLGFLERYLARQVELGRLRPHDPRSAARSFMGMLIVYVLGHEIFPDVAAGFPPAETYAGQVVALFLEGLRPTVAER